MEVWCGLSPGGFPPGRREQEAGFLFAWENRSSAWAHTRKEPRACETQERKRHGARLARRRRAPGINRVRARHGNETNPVRDLLTAGALLAGLAALRAANRRLTWETPEKPGSRAQLFKRFCALGDAPGLLPSPGKQKLSVGAHSETAAGGRGWAKTQTRCVNCSPQVCPPQARVRARRGEGNDRANRFAGGRRTTGCSAGDEPADADSPAPGRRVRDLLTAGVQRIANRG